ncbi:MAG TPA: glycosyltransferase family 39 protein [Herpetosiphonaceae bacterium]|nr:glycosyltransferase family 39 protein [Herpetosiphonaceae bacterium]
MQRSYKLLLLAGVIATLAIHAWSLMRFPAVFVDEVWLLSRAWRFNQTGQTFGMLDAGVADRYPGYWTFLPWLGNALQGAALRFSEYPNLLPVRALSLAMGGLLLLAVFSIARRLGGAPAAWLAVALTAYSDPFWQSAHQARYDCMVAAICFSALALALLDETWPRWWLRVLCGLAVGLAIEIHAFAAIYAVPVAALYLQRYGWRIVREPGPWQVLAGALLGLAFYVAMHILPYPESYALLNKLYFGPSHVPPLVTLDPAVMLRSLIDTLDSILRFSLLQLPLLIGAAVWMLRYPTPERRRWLLMTGTLLLAFALLLHSHFDFYNIYVSPAFDIGVAMAVAWLWRQPLPRLSPRSRRLALAAVACLCIVNIVAQARLVTVDANRPLAIVQGRIAATVRPGDVMMGMQNYWLELYDHRYYTYEQLIYYRRVHPGSSVAEAMAAFKPDLFIVDGHISRFLNDGPARSDFFESLSLPRAEIKSFLDQNAVLVDTIQLDPTQDDTYGTVQIFRLRWPDRPAGRMLTGLK